MEKNIIAVVGAKGKMGSEICKKLQKTHKIIKIDVENSINNAKTANLVIDFAGAKQSVCTAKFCGENKIALIIGSTGQTNEELKKIEQYTKSIPFMFCKNFSVGIMLLKKMSALILENTDPSITILEKHHIEKKDAPSGTAMDLAEHIKIKSNKHVTILSERGGKEIGTHKIDFYFDDEVISVSHQAFSREAFVSGVKLSAEFMLKQKEAKKYDFEDVIKNNQFCN